MLSIGKLGVATGAEYYLTTVANSVDDYYLGRGEAPGQWIGTAAANLGLVGQVDPDALRHLLGGLSADGEPLGARLSEDRRPGFDLTFSAPKSISLLWAFGSEEIRQVISSAHDLSVRATLNQLSAEACYARRGAGGHQLIEANGFIGTAFRHRTSRAGDPQLHTHVVVPNLVQGSDGQWSAPDGRQLYSWKMAAGALYRSSLRAELAPLGLAWQVQRNGLGEVAGIPKALLRAFSTRRAEIEASLEARGLTSARAAAQAALATRPARSPTAEATDLLRESWSARLAEIKVPNGKDGERAATVEDIAAALNRQPSELPDVAQIEAVFSILAGEERVSLDEWELDERAVAEQGSGRKVMPITLLGSTFSRRDAITAIAGAFDLTPREAVAFTSRFLDRQSVVRVLAEPETGRDTDLGTERLRTKGGQLVPVTSGDRRYTTTELLAAEQRIVTAATGSIDAGRGWIPLEVADQVLGVHPHLDDEQIQGVRKLLTSGNGWDLVVGQAGTGKSTMLRAARLGWEAGGQKVIGAAIAARTAADLEAGTGIPSSSLAQILVDLRESGGLSKHHVVVVDEASLVGTRALDELRSRVEPTGAKVVLVGDNRQLSSIDAGGALRTLASELGPHVVTLTTNRRQGGADQQWERDALVNLRDGIPAPAVQAYLDHGRITLTQDIDEARNRLIDDWWAVHHERSTAIMAVRRSDVAALNELARGRRQAGAELGREYRLGEKTFSVGDRVIFERNQKVHMTDEQRGMQAERVRIRNGTFATVVGLTSAGVTGVGVDSRIGSEHERGEQQREAWTRAGDGEGDVRGGVHEAAPAGADRAAGLVVELDDGKRVILPAQYVEASTSLGYALTVFRSQGITVDHAFGLAGAGLSQEAGYTQLSRGRLSNNLYVTAPENPRWEIGHHADDLSQRDALQSLVDALAQSREQTMARDRLPSWPTVSSSDLDAAYREHASLGQWMAEHAPADVTRQLADAYVATVDDVEVGHSDPQAQDHVKELQAAQREREAWVTAHRTEIATWSQLDQDIQRYQYRLGQAASFSPPTYTTASLGSLPDQITEVERWKSAAGAIEAYRLRWGVDAPTAIGPEPQDPEQRAHWQNTFDVVESASSGLPGAWGDPDGTERAELLEMLEQIRSDLEQIGTGLTEYRESLHKAPAIDWGYDDPGYDNDYTIDNDYGYGL